MEHSIDSFGNVRTCNYERIRVSASGSGDEVILILGRKTSPSSIIEMKPLVSLLNDKYTVVTLDYLGTGYSEAPRERCTTGSVARVIHEVMEVLGYTRYTIIAAAYGGIYALRYANRYSDEVKAVIGIDAFVPKQNDIPGRSDDKQSMYDVWFEFHRSKLMQKIVAWRSKRCLEKAESYIFKTCELEDYADNAVHMLKDMWNMEVYKCTDENFERLKNVHFPPHIPVLTFLSSYRCITVSRWYKMHEAFLSANAGKIIKLKGGKHLHLTQTSSLAKEIDAFIAENK